MKSRQSIAFCVLMGGLPVSSVSTSAEEKPLNALQTLAELPTSRHYEK